MLPAAKVVRPLKAGAGPGPRPFQVVTVASNKGGVGKTTIATNLAVYLRALREDLPILLLGLDEQQMIERMFALDETPPDQTIADALRTGSLTSAMRLGEFGIHYVPSSNEISDLKREIHNPLHLQGVLRRTDWHGLVIVDTKSDLEILTTNAIATSDLTIVVVKDQASLIEADKVFDLLDKWNRPRDHARVVLSMVDLRIKYREGEAMDVLALLVSEIRRRNYPLFTSFISSTTAVESLYTNPNGSAHSILTGAPKSVVDGQMRHLAHDVMTVLDEKRATDCATPSRRPIWDETTASARNPLLSGKGSRSPEVDDRPGRTGTITGIPEDRRTSSSRSGVVTSR
jgi:cellulose biosynthesis protein BcsQ